MRPTARARRNPVLATTAKLCRQYLKWFGNASYQPARNGERWLLDTLRGEPMRTIVDVGANVGNWSLMAAELFPQATIYALEVVPPPPRRSGREPAGSRTSKPSTLGWPTTTVP
jgi:hypothetical protein